MLNSFYMVFLVVHWSCQERLRFSIGIARCVMEHGVSLCSLRVSLHSFFSRAILHKPKFLTILKRQPELRFFFDPCLIKPHDQLLLFSFPSVFSLVIRSMCTRTGLTNWAIGSRWFLVSLKLSKTRD